MKNHLLTLALAATLCLSHACSALNELKHMPEERSEIPETTWRTDAHFEFHTKRHRKTKNETERLFRLWLEENRLGRNVTHSTLEKITFREDDCSLSYSYRCFDGRTGRVVITTTDYTKEK